MIDFKSMGNTSTNEVIAIEHNGAPHYMHHDRMVLDQKAKLMIALVQSWSHVGLYGDAMKEMMAQMHEQPHVRAIQKERQPIEQLVFLAADAADAIYAEAERRGWAIVLPPYGQGTSGQ